MGVIDEEVIVYRKEKAISYDEKSGEIIFHKSYYTISEVEDALIEIKTKIAKGEKDE